MDVPQNCFFKQQFCDVVILKRLTLPVAALRLILSPLSAGVHLRMERRAGPAPRAFLQTTTEFS
jgi:hypothetical protein